MKNSKLYSIIIPVYGSSNSLVEIAERTKAVFTSLPERHCELIFVNDYSPNPQTETTLQHLIATEKNITIITFSKNFGQQAATLCGIHYAKGDFIITMDDDLQHNPEDIPRLIEREEHDVVFAAFQKKRHPFLQRLASRIKGYFDHMILDKPKHLQLTSFRLINRRIAKELINYQTSYPFIPAMLFRITSDVVNVVVQHHDRFDENSQYTLWKMVKLFSNLIINNSFVMLKLLGIIGIGGFLISLLLSLYLIVQYFYQGFRVSGWASLMLAVVFLGGLILFGVGVIGEYLLRILANLEHNRMYSIKRVQKHD